MGVISGGCVVCGKREPNPEDMTERYCNDCLPKEDREFYERMERSMREKGHFP